MADETYKHETPAIEKWNSLGVISLASASRCTDQYWLHPSFLVENRA
jgi:hypothetical protein